MPIEKTLSHEEAALLVENSIIKMAGAIRNRIKYDKMTDMDEILKHDAVWFWLADARKALSRIEIK